MSSCAKARSSFWAALVRCQCVNWRRCTRPFRILWRSWMRRCLGAAPPELARGLAALTALRAFRILGNPCSFDMLWPKTECIPSNYRNFPLWQKLGQCQKSERCLKSSLSPPSAASSSRCAPWRWLAWRTSRSHGILSLGLGYRRSWCVSRFLYFFLGLEAFETGRQGLLLARLGVLGLRLCSAFLLYFQLRLVFGWALYTISGLIRFVFPIKFDISFLDPGLFAGFG